MGMARSRSARPWRRTRAEALQRDRGLCLHCLAKGRYTRATEVDHIKRLADGGTNSLESLQSLCTPCHQAKTRIENGGKDMACDPMGIPDSPLHHWNAG